MEQENRSMRERLLARLPQPENLAGYREETASLMAKHEKELFWEKWSFETLLFCAFVVGIMVSSDWAQRLDHRTSVGLFGLAGLMLFAAISTGLRYYINRSKVDLLKEVKQVQVQILELQASLQQNRQP